MGIVLEVILRITHSIGSTRTKDALITKFCLKRDSRWVLALGDKLHQGFVVLNPITLNAVLECL